MAVFWVVAPYRLVCVYQRFIVAMMVEAVRTCEMLVNLYQSTRRYNPEDRHLLSQRRKNHKSF
jgi:hypothetical protein